MEIKKRNESFNLTDVTSTYKVHGSCNHNMNGTVEINLNVCSLDGSQIGTCVYHNYDKETGECFNIMCKEEHRIAIIEYFNNVIKEVTEYLTPLV